MWSQSFHSNGGRHDGQNKDVKKILMGDKCSGVKRSPGRQGALGEGAGVTVLDLGVFSMLVERPLSCGSSLIPVTVLLPNCSVISIL